MKTRRSITLTIILAALVSAFGLAALTRAGAAGGVKNVTTSLLVPLDESVYNPATGETVNFVGDVRFIAHTKTLADGSVIVSIQDNGLIPGTGDKTGDHYTGKNSQLKHVQLQRDGLPLHRHYSVRPARPQCRELQRY